jgi:large subunit ribosomal protein L19
MDKLRTFSKNQLKEKIPPLHPGDTIRVYQKIKEKDKERVQVFEGVVIAKKHGRGISSTITVRKIISSVGVEKTFPIHSPNIEKIEILGRGKTRRAKLYYLRKAKGKKTRLKRIEIKEKTGLSDKIVARLERGGGEKKDKDETSPETTEEKTEK